MTFAPCGFGLGVGSGIRQPAAEENASRLSRLRDPAVQKSVKLVQTVRIASRMGYHLALRRETWRPGAPVMLDRALAGMTDSCRGSG